MIDHLGVPRTLLLTILLAATALLAACGQVVTLAPPQASLPPDNTPTATRDTPVPRSTTRASSYAMADTATPTVTPTPVVHIVQQGDTLQAIAFDFGVSVEALQRVNGIENPQFLQIGQRLVIPKEEESGQAMPGLLLPTPTPHPIGVQGVAFYETPVDSLLGLGEVVNTTAVTLTNVQVRVTLLDSAGESLIETDTFAAMDIVPPGSRSPFSVLLATPPSDWASYQVSVIRGQGAGGLAAGYVPMSVVTAEGRLSGPQFQVLGTVENVSAKSTVRSVEMIVTTYDDEGIVTGFRQASLMPNEAEGELRPGGEMAFNLSLTAHGECPADFAVTVLGRATAGMTSGG